MPTNSAILVTGASSPIGAYFCERLAADYPGRAIIGTYGNNKPSVTAPNITYVQADFLKDAAASISDAQAAQIGTVIHLASVTPGNNPSGEISHYYDGNVHGVTPLIRRIADAGGMPHVFFLSSSAVYNRSKGTRIDELSEKSHADHYGLSKLMFENEMTTFTAHYPTRALGLRVPVLLVEGVKYNFISKWKQAIKDGATLKIGNPDAPFNAICPAWTLYDACKQHMVGEGRGFQVSNIFAQTPSTLRTILDAVKGAKWEEVPAAAPPQLITSLHQQTPFPAYSALEEVRSFLL